MFADAKMIISSLQYNEKPAADFGEISSGDFVCLLDEIKRLRPKQLRNLIFRTDKCLIDYDALFSMLMELAAQTSLVELAFSSLTINKENADKLAAFLKNYRLRALSLINVNFTEGFLPLIFSALKTGKTINSLEIIESKAVASPVSFLEILAALESLNELKHFRLSANVIGVVSLPEEEILPLVSDFFRILASKESLASLELVATDDVSPVFLSVLAEQSGAFLSNCANVTSFTLTGFDLGREALTCLLAGVNACGSLKKLKLNRCKIPEEMIADLFKPLATNRSLRELDVQNTRLGFPGLNAMSDMIDENYSLSELYFHAPVEMKQTADAWGALETKFSAAIQKNIRLRRLNGGFKEWVKPILDRNNALYDLIKRCAGAECADHDPAQLLKFLKSFFIPDELFHQQFGRLVIPFVVDITEEEKDDRPFSKVFLLLYHRCIKAPPPLNVLAALQFQDLYATAPLPAQTEKMPLALRRELNNWGFCLNFFGSGKEKSKEAAAKPGSSDAIAQPESAPAAPCIAAAYKLSGS